MSTKKPQDHRPADDELLTIDTAKGQVKVYPLHPNTGFIRKNRHLSEMDLTFAMVEKFAPEDALDVIDELNAGDELQQFMETWQEESGNTVGESSRSSN